MNISSHHGSGDTSEAVGEGTILSINYVLGTLYFNDGLALARKRQYDDAVMKLERAADLCPSISAPLFVLAKIALYRGELGRCRAYIEQCTTPSGSDSRQAARLRAAITAAADRSRRQTVDRIARRALIRSSVNALSSLVAHRPALGINLYRLLFAETIVAVCILSLLFPQKGRKRYRDFIDTIDILVISTCLLDIKRMRRVTKRIELRRGPVRD